MPKIVPYYNAKADSILYLNLNCEEQSYCITFSSCSRLKFRNNTEGTNYIPNIKCTSFDIYKYNDPYEYFESIFQLI